MMQPNEKQQQQPPAIGNKNEDISAGILQEPKDDHVLCGKSNDCLNHVGSIRFREYLETYVEAYAQATTKYAKMQLTKEIYVNLSKNSRFLKYNQKSELWEQVSETNVRDKRKAPELTIPTAATATLLQTKASVSNRKPSSDESLSKRPKTAFGKRHSWPFLEPEGADDMVAGQSHPKKPKRVRDPLSVNTDVASSEENEQAFYSDYAVAPVRRRHTSGASPQQWSPITSKMAQGHQHQYSQQVDCSDESSSNDSLCILPVIHSFVPSALAQTDNHGPFVVPPASSALSLLRKNPDKSSEALSKEFGIYSDMKRQKADDSFMGMLAIKRAESGPQKGKDSKNQNKQRGLSYLDEQKGYPLAKDAATPASTPTVATGNREAPTVPAEPSAEEVTRKIATHIFGDVSPDKDDFAGASVMQEPTMDWD